MDCSCCSYSLTGGDNYTKGYLMGVDNLCSEQMAGFKSQLCQFLAVCSWTDYITTPCLSHLICKNREDDTTYFQRLS